MAILGTKGSGVVRTEADISRDMAVNLQADVGAKLTDLPRLFQPSLGPSLSLLEIIFQTTLKPSPACQIHSADTKLY